MRKIEALEEGTEVIQKVVEEAHLDQRVEHSHMEADQDKAPKLIHKVVKGVNLEKVEEAILRKLKETTQKVDLKASHKKVENHKRVSRANHKRVINIIQKMGTLNIL